MSLYAILESISAVEYPYNKAQILTVHALRYVAKTTRQLHSLVSKICYWKSHCLKNKFCMLITINHNINSDPKLWTHWWIWITGWTSEMIICWLIFLYRNSFCTQQFQYRKSVCIATVTLQNSFCIGRVSVVQQFL